ncbi:hypothetical protein [Chelatococcus asaccharovorans]|uniref:Uncharacterized protein n=1 Tax=Chelatococcus asaccharovorans TaxID=28210 RepID=A0A2V3TZT5_9HYPH|nr:hypothetical protein [Chelatococcus asaccharovorans]MBS7707771.1 hypothetical protein [Chelatococcus asaccharovorans]PXW55068.1 hypothetical protein C7450_1105 [Chelatococcus asaccharovorans]
MSGFYVLDVPDFRSLVENARRDPACTVHDVVAGYTFIEFHEEIEIDRAATKLGEAVWFGCLTGGLDGRITHFSPGKLRLAPTNLPILPDQGH